MSFSTVTFSGAASGIAGSQGTSGTFTAMITGNADGTVSGTWTFAGTYQDTGYYATSGAENISGTLTGTSSAGADGPWPITLAGNSIINEGMQLSFANGQFTLAVAAGFGVDYSVDLGYGDRINWHDQFDFKAQLSAPGPIPGGGTPTGTSGNDMLSVPASGNVTIDGASGIDTAVFGDVRANYAVTHNTDGSFTVTHGSAGTDTLVNVERMQFIDEKVALDIGGDGGQAYRLYQAAFDRTPDMGGLGFWINSLDQGASLTQAASFFVVSPEFTGRYGNLDNQQFATQLYENVLHRAPDASGLAFWQGQLDQGTMSRAQVLVGFSESPENQADVIGQIQDGFQYG
jgi:hypothetical protein